MRVRRYPQQWKEKPASVCYRAPGSTSKPSQWHHLFTWLGMACPSTWILRTCEGQTRLSTLPPIMLATGIVHTASESLRWPPRCRNKPLASPTCLYQAYVKTRRTRVIAVDYPRPSYRSTRPPDQSIKRLQYPAKGLS